MDDVLTVKSLVDVLLEEKTITPEQLQELRVKAGEQGVSVVNLLEEQRIVSDDQLAHARAKALHLPYMDLFEKQISPAVLNIIPRDVAETYQTIAFDRQEKSVLVAMVDPSDFKAIEALEFVARSQGVHLAFHVMSVASFHNALKKYDSLTEEVEQALESQQLEEQMITSAKKAPEEDAGGAKDVIRNAPVSKMVSVIIKHAVDGSSSDIHIEPHDGETRVRYRVDGILHTSIMLPSKMHDAIVARIKVMANLKIDETRIPQDGRFRVKVSGKYIDFRISTLPLMGKEKVVLRILDTSTNTLTLEQLGFRGHSQRAILDNINKSHGMLLVTGPTGSGKSTTLYSMLKILNEEGVNIVTLEDPVEYFMQGVNQSQVNPEVGLTFAKGLRSILRQDPDVIMVGEIRDNETAELAVHAALTGHIVLSTLHTNDAVGAVPRLMDMKIEPFLISSSLNVVEAQRLVRRVCEFCAEEYHLDEVMEAEVARALEEVPKEELPENLKLTKPLTFKRGKGCARCDNTGYRGRTTITECVEMTDEMKAILVAGNKASEVQEELKRQGMITMKQDGLIKALLGVTTVEEVWTVTKE